MYEITSHLFIDAAPGATCRNWKEKSKSSSNVTSAKRCGNAFLHKNEVWKCHPHVFPVPPTRPLHPWL